MSEQNFPEILRPNAPKRPPRNRRGRKAIVDGASGEERRRCGAGPDAPRLILGGKPMKF
jgi:hypothetical protein